MPRDELGQSVGQALRRLREHARLSVRDAAARLDWSGAKLSRIETAASRVKVGDLDRLLDLYEADSATRIRIQRLLDSSTGGVVPHALREFADLEARATRISLYAAIIVPGLMQIPEYADAIIRAHGAATLGEPGPEETFAQEHLNLRLLRQKIFISGVAIDVIVDEAAVVRRVGGDDVWIRQVARLREFMRRPNTNVRVLRMAVGAHPALTGPFAILDFPDGGDPCVFCDGLTGGVLRTHADDVIRYRACFEALQTLALGPDESDAFLADLRVS